MAKLAIREKVVRSSLAVAACFPFLNHSPCEAGPSQASPFLELESEVSVSAFGVGLDIAATPEGDLYVSSESRGGICRLAEDGSTWISLIPQKPGPEVPRHPESIEVDLSSNLWVSDSDRHRVVVLDPQLHVLYVYQDSGRVLREPTLLSHRDENHMAVWNADKGALVLLAKQPPAITSFPPVSGVDYCVAADPVTSFCVKTDRKTLVRYDNGRVVGTWMSRGPYARVGGLEAAPDGEIYLSDASGRRIFALTRDLESATRFRLYESLFQAPTRLAVAGERLWVVDEGRKTVMRFRLRTAVTAWEHALLGEEYLALSLHEAALQELKQAEGLGLNHPDLTLNTGIALYGLGRYQDALATWDRVPHPPERQALFDLWRGNALFRIGRYKEAAAAYDAVPQGDREHTRARFNLSQTYLASGEYRLAKDELLSLLVHQPENEFARVSLARAHIGLGEYQEAKVQLAAASEGGPAVDIARYYLGHIRLKTGDAQAALPLLEQAAKQGPYFRDALSDLVEANRLLGDIEQANVYEQRLKSLQEDADALAAFILEDEL